MEHTAGMATKTRTLEGCQQERPNDDVAGKETEVVGGARPAGSSVNEFYRSQEVKEGMAQGKTSTVKEISVLSRWLFVSGLYTPMLPCTQ